MIRVGSSVITSEIGSEMSLETRADAGSAKDVFLNSWLSPQNDSCLQIFKKTRGELCMLAADFLTRCHSGNSDPVLLLEY